MGRKPSNGGPSFRFNNAEVAEMESILQAHHIQVPGREVLVGLAHKFSNTPERLGKLEVQIKQVWNWFQNRRYALRAKSGNLRHAFTPSSVQGEANNVSENSLMEFEARSARDGAWYDVTWFLSHRSLETGDQEVLVRFAGFGPEEDEWVNVRKHIRQRSLPCESSECVAVLPGDLILCFQEGKEQALYFDAHVFDSQRRRHDARGCRCRFLVRYDHDQSEEIVPLRKICRRPETDYRLQQLHAEDAKVIHHRAATDMYSSNHEKGHAPAETTTEQSKVDARAGSIGSQSVGGLKLSTHSPSGNSPKVNLNSETQKLPHTTKTPVSVVGSQVLSATECHAAAATATLASLPEPGESKELLEITRHQHPEEQIMPATEGHEVALFAATPDLSSRPEAGKSKEPCEATEPQYFAETHADTTVPTLMSPTEEVLGVAVATSFSTQIPVPKHSESEVSMETPQLSVDTQLLPATEYHRAVVTTETPTQALPIKNCESEASLEMSPLQDTTEPLVDTVTTQVLPAIELHGSGVGASTITRISLPEANNSRVLLEMSQAPHLEETCEDSLSIQVPSSAVAAAPTQTPLAEHSDTNTLAGEKPTLGLM